MIEPTSLSMHQDVTFLIKSDMAEHQIMQSIMRHVAREFASADLIAASLLSGLTLKADADQRTGIPVNNVIAALLRSNQFNYPLALKRGLEKFGWKQFRSEEQHRPKDWQKNQHTKPDSEQHSDETTLNDEDIAVFQAIDALMPKLQDEGLCAGVQLGLYRTPATMNSFWRSNLVVVLLPIDGQLGRRRAVFTFLLRAGFEPRTIQGRVTMQAGNPVHPLPHQELYYQNSAQLVISSRLVLEGQVLNGKSFLLGLISKMPLARHWLDLDHRDLDS